METNNNVITAITLMERMKTLLHEQDRAPISRRHLEQINSRIGTALELINPAIQSVLVLVPLGEVAELIDTMLHEPNFIETSEEIKAIICDKVNDALYNLYLEGGKYYETHEFDYSIGQDTVIQKMIDYNIQNGYYFGVEVQI